MGSRRVVKAALGTYTVRPRTATEVGLDRPSSAVSTGWTLPSGWIRTTWLPELSAASTLRPYPGKAKSSMPVSPSARVSTGPAVPSGPTGMRSSVPRSLLDTHTASRRTLMPLTPEPWAAGAGSGASAGPDAHFVAVPPVCGTRQTVPCTESAA